jgi:hypothetical protein
MPKLDTSITQQQGNNAPLELSEPRRAPSVHSDVTVPLSQALVTAFAITLIPLSIGGMGIILFGTDGGGTWWKLLTLFCVLVFAVTLAKAWFWRVAWVESTIEKLESMTGLDLNDDGYVPPHFYSVRGQNDKRPVDPVEAERRLLLEFVEWAFSYGTSVDALERRFDRKEIARFRALLMRQDVGCAEWNNAKSAQSGWKFTRPRDEVLRIVDNLQAVESLPIKSGYVDK